jgi:hypothetical protein
VPDGDVLDVRVLLPDMCDGGFEPVRKRLWLGFKLNPAVLKLPVAPVVDGLPVVVYDEARHLNVVLGQLVDSVEDLVLGESLTESVPCALQCQCFIDTKFAGILQYPSPSYQFSRHSGLMSYSRALISCFNSGLGALAICTTFRA